MKQTVWTRYLLLLSLLTLLLGLCVIGVCATEADADVTTEQVQTETETESGKKNPTNEELGGIFSAERIEWAISVTVQGMVMIFAVLALLWGVVAIFKVFLHDIPEKRAAKKKALASAKTEAAPVEQPEILPAAEQEDEGEIVAAITAAIAVMLQSDEYKDEFASGFRVVSFKRKGGAWNKDN